LVYDTSATIKQIYILIIKQKSQNWITVMLKARLIYEIVY